MRNARGSIGTVLHASASAIGIPDPPPLPPEIDWDDAVDTARRHRVLPLLNRYFHDGPADGPDPSIRATVQEECHAIAGRNLHLTTELHRLLERLRSAGLRVLPYKGPVIAATAYGGATRRQFLDLDLLIRGNDLDRATEVLRAEGYWPAKRLHALGEVVFTNEDDVLVDLHTNALPRYFPGSLSFDELWARRERRTVGDEDVPTLSTEDLVAILAVHGTKHCWQRVAWLVDIAALSEQRPIDWDDVWTRAKAIRATRNLAMGLHLVSSELRPRLPAAATFDRPSMRSAQPMARDAQAFLYGDDPVTLRERLAFHLRSLDRPSDRLRYVFRLGTIPTEGELRLVSLPGSLHPLYRVIRPVRLVGVYAPRVIGRLLPR